MKLFKQAQNFGSKALAVAAVATMGASSAFAQTNPITTMLESVDLAGVAAAVAAVGLIIVAVALTFKGPDVAKRVIRKV